MNQVTLCGRLTSSLELKKSQTSDVTYAQFTLAINDYRGTEKTTDFFDIIAFGYKAEQLMKYTEKGRKLLVVGRLTKRGYTNEQGNKVYHTKVILEDFDFMDYKREVAATVEVLEEASV